MRQYKKDVLLLVCLSILGFIAAVVGGVCWFFGMYLA